MKRSRTAAIAALVAAGLATPSLAACPGVLQSSGGSQTRIAALLSARHHVSGLKIARVFQQDGWSVYFSHEPSDVYFFYHGDPGATRELYLWGGSGSPDEYRDIRANMVKGAKGLPPALSACVARHASGS